MNSIVTDELFGTLSVRVAEIMVACDKKSQASFKTLGQLGIKMHEIQTRVKNGSLPFLPVIKILKGINPDANTSGPSLVAHLQNIIEGKHPIIHQFRNSRFPIWKTIEVGGQVDPDLFLDTLQEKGLLAPILREHLRQLDSIPMIVNKEQVDLIVLTPIDLGAAIPEIGVPATIPSMHHLFGFNLLKGWSERNLSGYYLDLCPKETAGHLCEVYRDQPKDEELLIASHMVCDSSYRQHERQFPEHILFTLKGGVIGFDKVGGPAGDLLRPTDKIVFRVVKI